MGRKRNSISGKKDGKNFRKWLILPGTVAAACVLAALTGDSGGYGASFFWENQSEAVSADTTSFSYRYEQEFLYTLWRYGTFRSCFYSDYSTAIPGLENTSFSASHSNQMVPQGICIAGDYMLISAYDKSGLEKSVLYVLSNEDAANRTLLTTIVLPDRNHVGGLAFDGSSLWVAKSTSKLLNEICYERIEEAVDSGRSVFELEGYDGEFNCGVTASFVSYQDGRLWVGTHHSFVSRQGALVVFRRAETEEADSGETSEAQANEKEEVQWIRQFSMEIPDYAQGIAFFSEGGRDYLLLSTSHGRFQSSYLYLYEETISDEKVVLSPRAKYEMPPMAEELVSDGGYTYCLFESAATCYSVGEGLKCEYPVDRVCALDNYLIAGNAE